MNSAMKKGTLGGLLTWFLIGAVLSPKVMTSYVYEAATVEREIKYRITRIVEAERTGDSTIVVCFAGSFDGAEGFYEVSLDIDDVYDGAYGDDVVRDETPKKIGVNQYILDDDKIRRDCEFSGEGVQLKSAPLKRTSGLGYQYLAEDAGAAGGVYWIDTKWNNDQLIVVGDFVGDDRYVVLRFRSVPIGTKPHYLLILPFAFVLDSLLFPIEWYYIFQFKG